MTRSQIRSMAPAFTSNSPRADASGRKGAVYLFVGRGDSWSGRQKVTAGDGAPRDLFGASVALSKDGGVALVGADGKDGTTGAAYVLSLGRN
jgi:hypothetical protein